MNKLCGHAHSPLGVGACFPYSLSQTGTPSLPPNYQRSSLLWVPPTPWHLHPSPSLFRTRDLLRRCQGLLGYRTIFMSGSIRSLIPGGRTRLALSTPRRVRCCLLVFRNHRPLPNRPFRDYNLQGRLSRYLCASPAFLPTHQATHYWITCKARYLACG